MKAQYKNAKRKHGLFLFVNNARNVYRFSGLIRLRWCCISTVSHLWEQTTIHPYSFTDSELLCLPLWINPLHFGFTADQGPARVGESVLLPVRPITHLDVIRLEIIECKLRRRSHSHFKKEVNVWFVGIEINFECHDE